jgi:phosphoribosylaminoimidazole-succinocarboxamide synthase
MTSPQNLPPQLSGNKSPLKLLREGKVRRVYELDDKLLLVSTDRISAFDHVLPTEIPGKGKILNAISAFWFLETKDLVANHVIAASVPEIKKIVPDLRLSAWHEGRVMLAKKARRIDFECVVRGYLAGSGWKEYLGTGSICGLSLPAGLKEAQKLPTPIFTPTTKADAGHDENTSFEAIAASIGGETAKALRDASLALYQFGADYLFKRGIILADTKFEFGFDENGGLIAIDEILTPDSSRFWDARSYRAGVSPASFDKQFVRDYLSGCGWDKNSAPPPLPEDVVEGTRKRYAQALERILGASVS